MPAGALLAFLLAVASPERDAARAELEAVAGRIEHLKARHAAGEHGLFPEIHRLLVRAQELALTLDRLDRAERPAGHPPRNAAPTAEELRERADAARDEADRIRTTIEKVDARLAALQAGSRAPQARFASSDPPPAHADNAEALEAQRTRLLRSLQSVLGEAERLDAEARLLESMK